MILVKTNHSYLSVGRHKVWLHHQVEHVRLDDDFFPAHCYNALPLFIIRDGGGKHVEAPLRVWALYGGGVIIVLLEGWSAGQRQVCQRPGWTQANVPLCYEMLIIIIRSLLSPNQIANQVINFEIKLKFKLFKNASNKSSQRNFKILHDNTPTASLDVRGEKLDENPRVGQPRCVMNWDMSFFFLKSSDFVQRC
jgi:hypothetical protein